jgi:hypothetical protein
MGHEDAESGRAGTQSTCTGLLGYRGHLLRLELICLGYVVCDWPEMSTGATDLCEALTVAPRARHGVTHQHGSVNRRPAAACRVKQ